MQLPRSSMHIRTASHLYRITTSPSCITLENATNSSRSLKLGRIFNIKVWWSNNLFLMTKDRAANKSKTLHLRSLFTRILSIFWMRCKIMMTMIMTMPCATRHKSQDNRGKTSPFLATLTWVLYLRQLAAYSPQNGVTFWGLLLLVKEALKGLNQWASALIIYLRKLKRNSKRLTNSLLKIGSSMHKGWKRSRRQ